MLRVSGLKSEELEVIIARLPDVTNLHFIWIDNANDPHIDSAKYLTIDQIIEHAKDDRYHPIWISKDLGL